jgi:PTS system nitrogen regulatory IIA component
MSGFVHALYLNGVGMSYMKLTVREASKLFSVSEKTIYRWIESKALPAYRINKQFRFNQTELLEWAAACRTSFSPDLLNEPESGSSPLPDPVHALAAGGIHYRVGGTDRNAVLQSVVELLRLPDHVDRKFLYEVLLAREALGSTGIGDGIAIPHARNPIVLNVERPTITLCFLENPVEFDALDGLPVTILFTLINPTVRAHLHLLSRLAFILSDKSFRDVLKRQGSRDEILAEARRVMQNLASGAE